jgi:hypothetical protein
MALGQLTASGILVSGLEWDGLLEHPDHLDPTPSDPTRLLEHSLVDPAGEPTRLLE